MAMDYRSWTDLIIDKFEGGYFHPDMYNANPAFFNNDSAYAKSGETYYGMDRAAGAPLTTSGAMVDFWKLIDQYYTPYHANLTYWNEKDGYLRNRKTRSAIPLTLKDKLRGYVAQTMSAQFEKLLKENFSDSQITWVKKHPKICFIFWYGTWNGSKFFKNFANVVKQTLAQTTNPDTVFDALIAYRKKTALKRTDDVAAMAKCVDGGGVSWLLIGVAAAIGVLFIVKSKQS